MKRILGLCLTALCVLSTALYATAFSVPSALINSPTVRDVEQGDITVGSYLGYFNHEKNEFDVMLNVAPLDNLVLSLVMLQPTRYVGHIHWQFYNTEKFGAAAGIMDLGNSAIADTWDAYPRTEENRYSQYLVTRSTFGKVNIHIGYGNKRFTMGEPGVKRKNSIDGLFGGFEFPFFSETKTIVEFDGKDYNIGFRVPVNHRSEFNIALSELFLNNSENSNYNNSPIRFITVGFTYRGNVFKKKETDVYDLETRLKRMDMTLKELHGMRDELKGEIDGYRAQKDQLSEEIERLRHAMKEDTRYISEQDKVKKEQLRRHYLGVNQELGEKVTKLYYESFEFYYKKEFFKAIESLQKAIVIDPYMPQLYVRLGSIYYELKMHKEALEMWEQAYALDPDNPELRPLLQKVK